MEDLFKKMESHLAKGFPFAMYCKPGSDVITGLFQNDGKTVYSAGFTQKGFLFAPFDGAKSAFIPMNNADVVTEKINADTTVELKPFQPIVDSLAKAAFEDLVIKGVKAIKEGRFKKVVLSRKQAVPLADKDLPELFERLLMAYPTAFRYCFYHPDTGLWMGATPEQLLEADERKLHTVALAGTQVYREGEEAVWENKEREEQQFVTDFITQSLNEYSDDIVITSPYTFRAGNIVHIKTDISADLKSDSNLEKIIQTLHPTPAVCGLPKEAAKAFILENEGYDRDYYSGYLGEINCDFATGDEGQTDLFVNLRCMKIVGPTANLYIGCGITKDSDPEKEFAETVNKAATMGRIIAG